MNNLLVAYEMLKWIVLLSLVVASQAEEKRKFPDDFLFGIASASFQIEGAWNEDGKGESIWDYLIHSRPDVVKDGTNGDIAADSYHKYKRDVQMLRELGVDTYRISLSWPRILPSGFTNKINQAGIDFYNNYINEMLKYNITPVVTLYHWDLPQKLHELGGWSNPLIANWFEEYARIAYEAFGDRVKYWMTFNEPREICYEGYGSTIKAPMLNSTAVGTYLCIKNLMIAHAKAYYAYNDDFKPVQGGQCGIALTLSWMEALTDTEEDKFAALMRLQGEVSIYADPIFSAEGGFPKEFSKRVADKSAQQGYRWSRLPTFTDDERALVRGSSDFLGVNHYTSRLISATKYKDKNVVPSILDDIDVGSYAPEDWHRSASSWLIQGPGSMYKMLTYLQKKYDAVLYVTENGWSTKSEEGLYDDGRVRYHRDALEGVLDALDAGVNVKGYMAWSLMDNFETMAGYTERFGLYHVDFESPARTRTARKSALVYKHIISHRYIDHSYEPESLNITIDKGH